MWLSRFVLHAVGPEPFASRLASWGRTAGLSSGYAIAEVEDVVKRLEALERGRPAAEARPAAPPRPLTEETMRALHQPLGRGAGARKVSSRGLLARICGTPAESPTGGETTPDVGDEAFPARWLSVAGPRPASAKARERATAKAPTKTWGRHVGLVES